MADPPPLPRRLSDMATVVGAGSALWTLGAAGLLITGQAPGVAFATCVAGAGLGGVGWGIFRWQRAAARRGSRGAQQGLDD